MQGFKSRQYNLLCQLFWLSVCSLAFEICLFTDTPEDVGNTFKQWFTTAKHKVVGTWSDVEKEVMGGCSCIKFDCGCCAHIEEKQIELNSTSKIVMVTERLFALLKGFMWCMVWLVLLLLASHLPPYVCMLCVVVKVACPDWLLKGRVLFLLSFVKIKVWSMQKQNWFQKWKCNYFALSL
jgi:hypothetical protein